MTSTLTSLRKIGTLILSACLVSSLLFGFSSSPSGAQDDPITCPAGTTLSADGTLCLSDAVNDNVTTTTSCIQGVLSNDGQTCIVPRLDAAPAAAPVEAPIPTFAG